MKGLITFIVLHTLLAHTNGQVKVSKENADEESPACFDKSGCLLLEIQAWFNTFKNINVPFKCNEKVDGASSSTDKSATPIYTLTRDCNGDDAIWQYRYTGSKGKKKIFNGKGKLSFIQKRSTPPHGFDYGLKSGLCIRNLDADIATIEGNFVDGVLEGEAQIIYFSRRKAKIFYVNGVANGYVRMYKAVDKLDSLDDMIVHLDSIYKYKNGVKIGHEWRINNDGTMVLLNLSDREKSVAVVPLEHGEYHVISGDVLVDEEIITKAKEAKIVAIDRDSCLSIPVVETYGDKTFDYDIQIKSPIKMTVAQIVRFLEKVSDEKVALSNLYTPNNDDLHPDKALKFIHIGSFAENYYFNVETKDGPGKAIIEANLDTNKRPTGYCIIKMLSTITRKKLYSNGIQNQTESTKDRQDIENHLIPLSQLPFR